MSDARRDLYTEDGRLVGSALATPDGFDDVRIDDPDVAARFQAGETVTLCLHPMKNLDLLLYGRRDDA
jgi:hypothetical protein